MKSFLLLALLMGVIFVQTATAGGSDSEGDANENGEGEDWEDGEGEGEGDEDENPEEETEPVFPSLICTIFGTQACNVGCLTVGAIYGTDSSGICDDDKVCECQTPDASLEDLWGRKFEPKAVLPKIKASPQLSQQVLEILKQPLRSTEETKQLLEPVLKDLHKDIRIKARAPCTIIAQAEGKFNPESAKKFTSAKLRPFINDQFPKGIDYKAVLNDALQKAPNEATFQNLLHEVRRTHNPYLGKTVDDFLKLAQKQEHPQEMKEDDIIDFVDHHIINELINSIETKAKPKPPQQQKSTKRPAAGKSTTTRTSTTSTPPQISRTVTSSSSSGQNPSTTLIAQYSLPDTTINKKLIDGFQSFVDKTWSGANYQVRFRRMSAKGDTELWWTKGNDQVYLHRHADGAVDQNWIFGGKVNIGLYRDVDKSQIQSWDFGNTRLDYEKTPNTMPLKEWMYNNKDEESYKKYVEVIQSWCNANDFFVGKEYCVIF